MRYFAYFEKPEWELYELCKRMCNIHNQGAIYNILRRGGINSINDLRNADVEDIAKFRGMGEKRMKYVIEMKQFIEDSV